jgi:hypothetical protein
MIGKIAVLDSAPPGNSEARDSACDSVKCLKSAGNAESEGEGSLGWSVRLLAHE